MSYRLSDMVVGGRFFVYHKDENAFFLFSCLFFFGLSGRPYFTLVTLFCANVNYDHYSGSGRYFTASWEFVKFSCHYEKKGEGDGTCRDVIRQRDSVTSVNADVFLRLRLQENSTKISSTRFLSNTCDKEKINWAHAQEVSTMRISR